MIHKYGNVVSTVSNTPPLNSPDDEARVAIKFQLDGQESGRTCDKQSTLKWNQTYDTLLLKQS